MVVSIAAVACGTDDGPASPASIGGSTIPTVVPAVSPTQASLTSGGQINVDSGNAAFVEVEPRGPLSSSELRLVNSAKRVWETNFGNRAIDLNTVISGGVPRDGIPPIDNPRYEPVSDAPDWLDEPEPVIAVEINGDARAFPLNILLRHEIVNTNVGGEPVAITYCPLCNSSLVFRSTIDGVPHRFGVSGFLRNSDLIMWDNKTQSWWQQLTGDAIVGDYVGRRLVQVPAQVVSWGTFVEEFPDGAVMDRPGRGGYDNTPYTGYDDAENQSPFLFRGSPDPRANAVDRVAAIDLGTGPIAYHFDFLNANPVLNDQIGEIPVLVLFDDGTESAFRSIREGGDHAVVGSSTTFNRELNGQILTFGIVDGEIKDEQTGSTWTRFGSATAGKLEGEELLPVIHGDHFWFAWAAFKPNTELVTSLDQVSAP